MRLRGVLSGIVVSLGAGLSIVGPASAQTGPTVSITPTSGPIGTTITATVSNCVGANSDGSARLDFAIEGFTPSNTEFFIPSAGGSAVVSIQALDKEGQTENATAATVVLSQCQVDTEASAPFTITRQQATTAVARAQVGYTGPAPEVQGFQLQREPRGLARSEVPGKPGGGLPVTGGDLAGLTVIGVGAVGAGSLLLRRTRRSS